MISQIKGDWPYEFTHPSVVIVNGKEEEVEKCSVCGNVEILGKWKESSSLLLQFNSLTNEYELFCWLPNKKIQFSFWITTKSGKKIQSKEQILKPNLEKMRKLFQKRENQFCQLQNELDQIKQHDTVSKKIKLEEGLKLQKEEEKRNYSTLIFYKGDSYKKILQNFKSKCPLIQIDSTQIHNFSSSPNNNNNNNFNNNNIFFGFNHTSSRFEHSFPMDEFIKIKEKFPEKEFIIIEFGLGDSKSAINNPPELSWFKHEKIENGQVKFKVIKFWYDTNFDFTAPQNEDSFQKIENDVFY